MKSKKEIREKILALRNKIEQAEITGKGYQTWSELRHDRSVINTLEWVLK